MDSILSKYYYVPKLGFTSAGKLYKRLKGDGYNIPLLTVKNWIKTQSVYQQYKYVTPIKRFFPIVSPNDKPFELLQVDLIDISNLSGSNNNIKYLLICSDVHSRFAFVTPTTNKNADTINISIEPILKNTNCLCLECDSGSEFTNKKFKDLLKQYEIKIIYVDVGNHDQLGIVDRICRTIRNLNNKYYNIKI